MKILARVRVETKRGEFDHGFHGNNYFQFNASSNNLTCEPGATAPNLVRRGLLIVARVCGEKCPPHLSAHAISPSITAFSTCRCSPIHCARSLKLRNVFPLRETSSHWPLSILARELKPSIFNSKMYWSESKGSRRRESGWA